MSSSSACPHLAVQKVPLPNLTSEKVLQIPPKESLRDGVESPDGKRVLAEFEFGPVCGLELDRRCRHLAGASCGVVVTSHQLEGPVGNQPRQGGPVQAR